MKTVNGKAKVRKRYINKGKKKLKRKENKKLEKNVEILIRNLPREATEESIEDFFVKFGDICHVKLIDRKGNKSLCSAVVQFTKGEDAEEAISGTSGELFLGRKVHVDWAQKKSHSPVEETTETEHRGSHTGEAEPISQRKKNERRGRIIIRNLSFKTTEKTFRDHFQEFGEITDIKLLKKPDGKLVGCGFIQFANKKNAIRAILQRSGKDFLGKFLKFYCMCWHNSPGLTTVGIELNLKIKESIPSEDLDFGGRPIICDWALPKSQFTAQSQKQQNVKESVVKIKEEPESSESEDDNNEKNEVKIFKTQLDSTKNAMDTDSDSEDFMEEGKSEEEEDTKKCAPERNRPKVFSNDATEGRTVFFKNVPFSATNVDLKECVEQFGPIHYALICVDPLTEYSKGTAFVKFRTKESAEKCLEACGKLVLHDQAIDILRALPRDAIKNKQELKKDKKAKDNRHLYLVKEGVILAGSPAARDVSVADMEKRLRIEQWKTQMLRNLNMFVSNTRLVVHNVPLTWNDNQVRSLFKKYSGPGAVVTEARIMRDMRNVDANGVGTSKEHAFVRFTQHQHALKALRNINNNPSIFTKAQRPIVSFSIENKIIHKVKEKRIQKSKLNNPTYINKSVGKESQTKSNKHQQTGIPNNSSESVTGNSFSGELAAPGSKKLRTKRNLKTQAAMHIQNVKKIKQKQKLHKKLGERKKPARNKRMMPQGMLKASEDGDSFTKLVNKYKSKMTSVESRKKWYE